VKTFCHCVDFLSSIKKIFFVNLTEKNQIFKNEASEGFFGHFLSFGFHDCFSFLGLKPQVLSQEAWQAVVSIAEESHRHLQRHRGHCH
jgi:hypothetical protein